MLSRAFLRAEANTILVEWLDRFATFLDTVMIQLATGNRGRD